MRFWDSSALVPLLVQQPASRHTDQWLAEDGQIAIWTLSVVEITSALWRLVRDGRLDESAAQQAEARSAQLAAASHAVVDVSGVRTLAQRVLRVHPLRAADALQLAAALLWAAGQPHLRVLHTLDDRLAAAARREGFDVPRG